MRKCCFILITAALLSFPAFAVFGDDDIPSPEPSIEISAEPSSSPTAEPSASPTTTPTPTVAPTPTPTPLPAPTGLFAEATQKGIALSWRTEYGVSAVNVYASDRRDTGYTELAVLDGNATTYIDTTIPYGVTRWYRIAAVKTISSSSDGNSWSRWDDWSGWNITPAPSFEPYNLTSELSEPVSALLKLGVAKLDGVDASKTAGTLNLRWSSVSLAQKNRVMRSTQKNTDYKTIKTVNATNSSMTDTKRPPAKLFYYKIVAVFVWQGKEYTSSSNIQSGRALIGAVGTLYETTAGPSTLTVHWSKVKSASGYRLYRSKDNGKTYQRIGLLAAGRTWVNVNGLEHGRQYFFKIEAYKKNKGKAYPGFGAVNAHYMDYYGYAAEDWGHKQTRVFGANGGSWYSSSGAAKPNMKNITLRCWNIRNGSKVTVYTTIAVQKNMAETVKKIFEEIYAGPEKFPINSIGCYEWRGDGSRSEHCIGTAIDINPEENYMIEGNGTISAGSFWRPGVNPYSIKPDGDVVRAMNKYGYSWGLWNSRKDYMHFSYFGT